MIRLPPSLLTLGPRDLLEYQERRKQRELEKVKRQFARFEIGGVDGPNFGHSRKFQTSSDEYVNASELLRESPEAAVHDHSLAGGNGYEEPRYCILGGPPSSKDQSSLRSDVASPENVSQVSLEGQQSSSPPKDGFHYGGFIESQSLRRSSPFAPEDVSTPQNLTHNRVSISCDPSFHFGNDI